jgi:DNA-binding NtrC family response regulator
MTDEKKKKTFAEVEKETIETALIECNYDIGKVVSLLNVSRYFLYSKIAEYNLVKPKPDEIIN